ncbi:MAG: type IX secretion system membrane protein PorP/SprF [Phaeodactylibacter sp.]|nr:type IX secretion system membrane protein PorP/SprF [Phaeodactylibacter sp.]
MKNSISSIAAALFLLFAHAGKTQQLAYHYGLDGNAFAWNPAMAGKYDYLSVGAAFHQPWSGFEGAPAQLNAFFEFPITLKKMGGGFAVTAEEIGASRTLAMVLAYNYRLRFGYRGRRQLSLGLAARYSRLDVRLPKAVVNAPDDPLIGLSRNAYKTINLGVGLFFSSSQEYFSENLFFAGIAAIPAIPYAPEGKISPAVHASAMAGASLKFDDDSWFFEPVVWVDYSVENLFYPQMSLKVERDLYYWLRLQIASNSIAPGFGYMVNLNDNTQIRISVSGRFFFGRLGAYVQRGMDGAVAYRSQPGYY